MGRTFAGILLLLVAGCTASAAREGGKSVKTIPVEHVTALAYVHSGGRLHLVRDARRQFVRLEGPSRSVDGVTVEQYGDTLSIRGAAGDMDVYVSARDLESVSLGSRESPGRAEGGQCRLAVTGSARVRLDSIVATIVQVYVDGAARLDVGNLTAGQFQSNLDGYGKMQPRAASLETRMDRGRRMLISPASRDTSRLESRGSQLHQDVVAGYRR